MPSRYQPMINGIRRDSIALLESAIFLAEKPGPGRTVLTTVGEISVGEIPPPSQKFMNFSEI